MKKGIDVSNANGEINWPQVSQDSQNIKFAFVKATEGKAFQDPEFKENFDGTKENNIEAVAYHVFRMNSTPDEQSQNITSTLTDAKFTNANKLAVSATAGICSAGKTENCDDPTQHTNQERANNLNNLLTKLGEEEYHPIVHASPQIWDNYYTQEQHNFSKYPLWITDRTENNLPQIPKDWQDARKSYEYWNYTDNGSVAGIKSVGKVSLNKTHPDTITQNFSKMQENFFNLGDAFEALENNFKQVSQSFSAAKEHALNLAVNSEDLAGNFLSCHPDICIV